FGVTCCRRVGHMLRDDRSRRAVELAERAAEGQSGHDEVLAALGAAWDAVHEAHEAAVAAWDSESAAAAAANTLARPPITAASAALDAVRNSEGGGAGEAERRHQADVLRDLLGPLPFRPVQVEACWRTPTVLALAAAIYDGRDFAAMPVLADAL